MYLKTLIDVGLVRVFGRIKYELRIFLDSKLPKRFILFLCNTGRNYPSLNKDFELLAISKFDKPNNNYSNKFSIEFNFLNQKYTMDYPFDWNMKDRSRLWIFNLHYFDWARELIEQRIKNRVWSKDSYYLEKLLDNWIDNNPPGNGDGWHSYTISLRIRNWIWIFRFFPSLISKKRINSLWEQICWLNAHTEDHLGGNHLIENLTALIIGASQFSNNKSRQIFEQAILKLEFELDKQILDDGGHQERSASYHLLLMDRLIETGFILDRTNYKRPIWLINNLKKMLEWAEKVTLLNGYFPNFNDSPLDGCANILIIKNFAKSYLFQKPLTCNSLRKEISKLNFIIKPTQKKINSYRNSTFTDLKDTGWTIIRFNNDLEIIFKCGTPCPLHLPGHVHSDQLSFDIYKKGEAIIAETGTSIYKRGGFRDFERSSRSHNIFQLGIPTKRNNNNIVENTNWIDSVECWDSFRAGRKAKVIYRKCIQESENIFRVIGSIDSNEYFEANHFRELKLIKTNEDILSVYIFDYVNCKRTMNWRSYWHLGPNQKESFMDDMIKKLKNEHDFDYFWENTWLSEGFGKRIPRRTLCLCGQISPGKYTFSHHIKV